MAKFTKLQERQMIIDDRKWLDGIKFGKFCDKTIDHPCARAYNKRHKANKSK